MKSVRVSPQLWWGTMSALALTACAVLAANARNSPEDWARCRVSGNPGSALFEEAQARETRVKGCFSIQGGVPRWHRPAAGADTVSARQSLAVLAKELAPYRAGRYAAIAPEGAPPGSREAMAELGTLLEQVAAVRLRALGCGQVDEATIGLVSDYDAMFTVAAVGRRVQPGGLDAVQAVAGTVLDTARTEALTRARAQTNVVCETNWRPEFDAHAAQWAKFAEGQHPWTPGCRVKEDGADLVLRCD